jgi:hypothetical protein
MVNKIKFEHIIIAALLLIAIACATRAWQYEKLQRQLIDCEEYNDNVAVTNGGGQ